MNSTKLSKFCAVSLAVVAAATWLVHRNARSGASDSVEPRNEVMLASPLDDVRSRAVREVSRGALEPNATARLGDVIRAAPSNEAELREFVGWMRSLSRQELLQLSNAEFGFEKSEIIE